MAFAHRFFSKNRLVRIVVGFVRKFFSENRNRSISSCALGGGEGVRDSLSFFIFPLRVPSCFAPFPGFLDRSVLKFPERIELGFL